jgi:hypothetical protein
MTVNRIVCASTVFAVTIGLVDVPLAAAHGGGGGGGGGHFAAHFQSPRVVQSKPHFTAYRLSRTDRRRTMHVEKHAHHLDSGRKHREHGLDKHAAHNSQLHPSILNGRLSVPHNLKPKLTLTKLPNAQFQKKMGPFVQKYWKKPFFWVALAGIGYVTVPELYYDRFLGCIEDEDYDGCVTMLSIAAVEEEDSVARVRYPMPATATYRYKASVAPSAVASSPADKSSTLASTAATCSLDPFVERKWNSAFVWVRIPETGNVTVPEDYYDRFQGAVANSPPNYQAACAVLSEAAAADMMTMAGATSDSGTEPVN